MINRDRVKSAARTLANAIREETDITNYKPIRDRVLVKIIPEPEHERKSGIWVPEDEKKWKAMVVAHGPGQMTDKGRIPPDVNSGDVVVIGAYIGERIDIEGIEFRMIKASDIMAVILGAENE